MVLISDQLKNSVTLVSVASTVVLDTGMKVVFMGGSKVVGISVVVSTSSSTENEEKQHLQIHNIKFYFSLVISVYN